MQSSQPRLEKLPDQVREVIRATHLWQNGYDLRTVQALLGHKDVKTPRFALTS